MHRHDPLHVELLPCQIIVKVNIKKHTVQRIRLHQKTSRPRAASAERVPSELAFVGETISFG